MIATYTVQEICEQITLYQSWHRAAKQRGEHDVANYYQQHLYALYAEQRRRRPRND